MAVCLAVSEIFSVEEWRDLENQVRGCSRSLKMAPFDRPYAILLVGHCKYSVILYHFRVFWRLITLTLGLEVTQCHWNGCHSKASKVSYSPSKVTVAVSVAVCEIFGVKEWCDLENMVRVRSRLLKMAPFDRSHISSYSLSIITMVLSCIDYDYDLLVVNREIFISHLYLAPPQGVTPSEFREDVWCW